MPERPKIVVVGSLNVDHVLRVARLPAPGETVTARGAFTSFGGKGANQALAAARAGGEVTLIGCVGRDDAGARYLEHLCGEGIRAEAIASADAPTGSAFILVDEAGENCIVVDPGANHRLEPHHLDERAAILRAASAILLQLECPLPAVLRAMELAAGSGVPVILNASPLTPEFVRASPEMDTLIVNEHEAAELAGAARARQLIVTQGAHPTLAIVAGRTLSIPPPKVTPVDTVGAGDAFAGAFTVASASGLSLEQAIRFANAAGALATQKPGAQASIPRREAILSLLAAG